MKRLLIYAGVLVLVLSISIWGAIKTFKSFMTAPSCSDFGRVALAIQTGSQYSFWGSSTCQLGIDAGMIEQSTSKTCENFGITGAHFYQLQHLFASALVPVNGKDSRERIFWVVNPMEFTMLESQFKERELFQPFVYAANLNFEGKERIDYFPPNYLFQLTERHWKFLRNDSLEVQGVCSNGSIIKSGMFTPIPDFMPTDQTIQKDKIDLFQSLADTVNARFPITIILPPIHPKATWGPWATSENFLPSKYKIWDFRTDTAFTQSHFLDELHLNQKGQTLLTQRILERL